MPMGKYSHRGADSVAHWSKPIYTLSGGRQTLKTVRQWLSLFVLLAMCGQLAQHLVHLPL